MADPTTQKLAALISRTWMAVVPGTGMNSLCLRLPLSFITDEIH